MNKYFRAFSALCGATALALGAEESATVNRNKVNVRGGPNLTSEVITQLQKGDTVTVIEDVAVEKPKAGEPAKWSAIKLPANTPVWVYTGFLNGTTVKAPRLNLRGGPGENFSVLGRLEKGATVKQIRVVDEWMEIEAPENARAYVDANYLSHPDAGKEVAAAKPALTEEKLNVFEPAKPVTAPPKTETKIEEPAKPVKGNPDPQPAQPKLAEAKQPAESKLEQRPVVTKLEEPTPAPAAPSETKVAEVKPAEPAPATTPAPKPLETAEVKEEPKLVAAAAKEEEKKPAATTPAAAPAKPEENAAKPAKETAAAPAPAPAKPASKVTTLPPPVEPAPARVLPEVAQPLPGQAVVVNAKRIVRREGDVRSTKYNIQAPTYFEMTGDKGKLINFLSGEKAGIKVKDYKGLHVIVTGEESIDPRFKETPLLEIETIEVAP